MFRNKFPHGICECKEACPCGLEPGPAAVSIDRNGAVLNVCTKCSNHTDKLLSLLVTTKTDSSSFIEYDEGGAQYVAMLLREKMRELADPNFRAN